MNLNFSQCLIALKDLVAARSFFAYHKKRVEKYSPLSTTHD